MKRIRKSLISIMVLIVVLITCVGCNEETPVDADVLKLCCSYELVAANVRTEQQITGDLSGAYVLCFGGMSGSVESNTNRVYDYWYKRQDGGILSKTIDMSSYCYPENVSIVIYENNSIIPKVEIWRNYWTHDEDGAYYKGKTEIRFTIPEGAFVTTYDFQGLEEKGQ